MWRSEMNDLSGLVSRLQEENSRLSTSLREKTNLLGEGHDDSDRSEGHFRFVIFPGFFFCVTYFS